MEHERPDRKCDPASGISTITVKPHKHSVVYLSLSLSRTHARTHTHTTLRSLSLSLSLSRTHARTHTHTHTSRSGVLQACGHSLKISRQPEKERKKHTLLWQNDVTTPLAVERLAVQVRDSRSLRQRYTREGHANFTWDIFLFLLGHDSIYRNLFSELYLTSSVAKITNNGRCNVRKQDPGIVISLV